MSFQENKDGTYRYTYTGSGVGNSGYDPYSSPHDNKPKKEKSNAGFYAKVIVAALIFGLVAGSVSFAVFRSGTMLFSGDESSPTTTVISNGKTVEGTAVSTATSINDVSDIVKNVMPAIVQVTNMSVVEYRGFFGQVYQMPSESAGSGVIIADDGNYIFIATNNHVVTNSREITITFSNDEAVAAELQGTYPNKDLAVVKVNREEIGEDTIKEIKMATLADSESLAVGQAVVAIGNALGYGQSVTTGVLSATEREVTLPDEATGGTITNKLLQTDAAINPGNSGGALLNMNGQVIGIVSAKYSDTAVEGMGYAIPITEAKGIIDELIETGTYNEQVPEENIVTESNGAYLGIVGGMDIDQSTAKRYGMPTGVYVSQVVANSAAANAGIVRGDVIRAVNGEQVSSIAGLQNVLAQYYPGDKVTVTVAKSKNNYQDTDIKVVLDDKSS